MGDMGSIDDRLSALETENKALRAELADIKQHGVRKVIAEPAPTERGVTVSYPAASSSFVMPTDSELKRLAQIVIAKHAWFGEVNGPGFHGTDDERVKDWMKQYRVSFAALGVFKWTAEPNHKVYLSWHISVVENYLRNIRCFENLRVGPFLTAALAHGDISYVLGRYPELGINEHSGRDAGTAWKRVLETGRLLPESAPAVRIEAKPSPVQIIGQGY